MAAKGWNHAHVPTFSAVSLPSPALQSQLYSTPEAKGQEALILCPAEASSQLFA